MTWNFKYSLIISTIIVLGTTLIARGIIPIIWYATVGHFIAKVIIGKDENSDKED